MKLFDTLTKISITINRGNNNSLIWVYLSGILSNIFSPVSGGVAFTGFVRKLGASDSIYGFLTALPAIAAIFMFIGAWALRCSGSRRKVFLRFFFPSRFLWVVVAFLAFEVSTLGASLTLIMLCALVFFASCLGSAGQVCYLSWVTDLIPTEIRGRFFASRVRSATIAGSITALAVGYYLDRHSGFSNFGLVFGVASLFGIADIACYLKVNEPVFREPAGIIKGISGILVPFGDQDFRQLLVFWSFTSFAFGIVAPFCPVYALEELRLKYSYVYFLLQIIPSVSSIVLLGLVGRWIDNFGSKRVINWLMKASISMPIFWVLSSRSNPFPVVAANLLGGAVGAGMDLAQMNLLMKTVPSDSHSSYFATYGVVVALANAVAFVVGGVIAEAVQPLIRGIIISSNGAPLTQYHVLFILSTLLRVISLTVFVPRLWEGDRATVSWSIG
ncbi:MAG: MFS transporter [Firmicutes bacterium]|nr:MFS transporter [Bacillota bacterium]